MAGRITDADEHQLVLLFRPGPGILIPGIPIHRIVRMLKQVRAGFFRKVIQKRSLILSHFVSF
jgi:hypothetical protein